MTRVYRVASTLAAVLLMGVSLAGCETFKPLDPTETRTVNGFEVTSVPCTETETIDQTYYCWGQTYNALLETLHQYILDERVPAARAYQVANLESAATPVVDALDQAYDDVRDGVEGLTEAQTSDAFNAALEEFISAYAALFSIFDEVT